MEEITDPNELIYDEFRLEYLNLISDENSKKNISNIDSVRTGYDMDDIKIGKIINADDPTNENLILKNYILIQNEELSNKTLIQNESHEKYNLRNVNKANHNQINQKNTRHIEESNIFSFLLI